MDKRWLIPDPKHKGEVKLVVGFKPADAICEAPHNFTNEMEPYIEIHNVLTKNGWEKHPKFDEQYLIDLREGKLKKKGKHAQHETVPHEIKGAIVLKKKSLAQIHNSMKLHQRFFFSILGYNFIIRAKHRGLRKVLKKIFGVNHDLNLGG